MSILPLQLARVSNLLRTSVSTNSIGSTQQQLLNVQNQLSTGKRVTLPSDDPSASSAIMQLQKTLEQRKTYSSNINQAQSQLSETDSTLSDLTGLLQQAQTLASANVGSDVTADQRAAAADVVQSLYNQALSIGNKQFNGTYLFAGDQNSKAPFVEADGGVKFVGSSTVLANQVDENTNLAFQADGSAVFGAVSTQVTGGADLTPLPAAQTRISDLRGAGSTGVTLGPIVLGNGTITKLVDLSQADTLGDVVTAINAAGVGGITAAVGAGGGLVVSGGAGDNITVSDVGSGTTVADLGIARATGAGAGAAVNGAPLQPRVTGLTKLSDLRGGAGISPQGLIISNGPKSVTIPLASPPLPVAPTVEDLLNAINGSAADVKAQINSAGTGIDIVNPTQGINMTIGENGGTTAADLGVRSFDGGTTLSSLNGGKGVGTVSGNDLQVTRKDGTSFGVDIDGAGTVHDVIDKINQADTANGTLPATVVASLAGSGNGIVLTDSTGGAGALAVTAVNLSTAAADLGLADRTATGATLTGKDVNPISAGGIFANLVKLRDALKASDTAQITDAAQGLQTDQDRVTRTRGQVGAQVQELEARSNQIDDENLATQSLLSNVQDVDFTEAISRFQTLQTQLQATLETAGKTLNMSLLDFLS